MHAMPALADRARDCGKGHLLGEHQHQRLEQQGEAGELADPVGLDQRHLAVRQLDPRHPYFEIAFMLKEVEMPKLLDLGVVDLVFARSLGVSKAAARHEIDVDGQSPLPSIEVHPLNEPGRSDPKGCRKQLVGHHPSTPQLVNPSSQGWSRRRVNRRSPQPVDLWTAGGHRRARAFQPPAAHNSTGSTTTIMLSINELYPLDFQKRQIFGRRPVTDGATCTGAGVRKPSREETAGWNASVVRQTRPDAPTLWGFERDGLNVRTAAGRLMARVVILDGRQRCRF